MRRFHSSQRGFSLATTLILVALVGGIASALIILSTNQMGVDQQTRNKVRATYLAEAGVEHMAHLIRKAHANSRDLETTSAKAGSTIIVDGRELTVLDLLVEEVDSKEPRNTYNVEKRDSGGVLQTDGNGDTISSDITIDGQRIALTAERYLSRRPPTASEEGYDAQSMTRQTTIVLYSIVAELRYAPSVEGSKLDLDESLRQTRSATLGRVVRAMEFEITPIFDKFAFWNSNLEILPGPRAIFNGRIHTNANLYIGAGTGLDINTDYIRAYGDMYRHRYDNPGGSAWAQVQINDPYKTAGVADPYNAQGKIGDNNWVWAAEYESNSDYNSKWDLNSSWLDNVTDAKLTNKIRNNDTDDANTLLLQPPDIDSIKPDGFYHQTADIVIQDKTVYKKIGTDSSGKSILEEVPASSLPDGLITTTEIYDAREEVSVPVTVIDVDKLNTSTVFPKNGVLYAYRTNTAPAGAGGSPARVAEGVQLKNGQTLAGDLTFVTNGPAYVQGNYNMDIDPSNLAANANKDLASKYTTPQPRKGAAIMGDAVNVLSEGWTNSKVKGSSPPKAKETTLNFALVTGNVPTNPGVNYSGGLENLPRFHEDWGGINLNYQGSLMCLWESEISTGRWGKGNVYSPPNRNWDFDARFGDPNASAKPPLFPQTVNINRTIYQEGYPVVVEEK